MADANVTTHILVVLDRSGSMADARSDHEGGLKSFIDSQKDAEGDARLTVVQFDSVNPCEIVCDNVSIEKAPAIPLIPRGGTPLLDAIGKSLAHFGASVPDLDDHPAIVMIITDGQENESREWTRARVKTRIEELTKKGWTFLFLGANVDAFAEASQLGIAQDFATGYLNRRRQVQAVYASAGGNLSRARSASLASRRMGRPPAPAAAAAMKFSPKQRASMTIESDKESE